MGHHLHETLRLLDSAWSALSGPDGATTGVGFSGWRNGLLASPFPCLEAMCAAVACSCLAVAEADAARNGAAPRAASIDVAHVAVAARSERYAHEVGSAPPHLFDPLSRFWRTADGWLRTHANYPWHRERLLKVLACSDDVEAVEAAVRRWPGEELERALHEAGGLGFAVRSRQEWLAHPQGRAVAALPLLTTGGGGTAGRGLPPEPMLAGVRVLDMTRVIAGPVATRTLAGWGADVLRLDSPRLPEIAAQSIDTLPGKRSAVLDAATRNGRRELEALLSEADVLVQGYRPGGLAKLGLAAPDVAERHPHLSVVTISAWGTAGPWAQRRGFDSLVQAATGIAAAQGDGTDRPGALPAQVLDHATGHLAAAAAALALASVARREGPRHAELSLAQTADWLQSSGTAGRERTAEPRTDADLSDADRCMVTLPGPATGVRVVASPGAVGGVRPRWATTTGLGADEPRFLARG